MARVKVDVAPSVMIWARESMGLSLEEAAKRIKMSVLDLRWLEEGAGDPSFSQVERMAKVYHRSLIAFFLSEPPNDVDQMPDFRLVPGNRARVWSPEMHEAFRRVRAQREAALAIAEATDDEPASFDLSIDVGDETERTGMKIRSWLDAPLPDYFAARTPGQALSAWSGLIERWPILVAQVEGVPIDEMRGFSLTSRPYPIIAVNTTDSPRGRTFTLLHELVHVLLHEDALCDLGQQRTPKGQKAHVERCCNEVAAAVLMPSDEIEGHPLVPSAGAHPAWTDRDLKTLAEGFGVSTEALLLRLVTLDRASIGFYLRKRQHFLAIYEEQRQRQEQKKSSGGLTYYRRKLRNYGSRYVRTVIDAYEREHIGGTDLAYYLDIKLNHLPALVEELDRVA